MKLPLSTLVIERYSGIEIGDGYSWWAIKSAIPKRKYIILPSNSAIRLIVSERSLPPKPRIKFGGRYSWGMYIGLPAGLKKEFREDLRSIIEDQVVFVPRNLFRPVWR